MRIERADRAIESSGVMEVAVATIKATPKIFNFFADQTYADKPRAIARELVANAIDSHVMAGTPDRPVEVTLPTDLDPVFKVRDHGLGMSHSFVMGDFMAYADGSTKDQSDVAIGGFGIGSKSPFAYVDQFTLRSVHDGQLSVYTLFKNEDGLPAVGLMGQTTTTEHNGCEFSFPVENDDHEAFHEAAQVALQFFRPLPLVVGGTLNAPDYSYVGSNWSLRTKAGDLNVILGGVRYPVANNSLSAKLRTSAKLSPLLTYGLDLILPIGSCGIALSREALSYDGKTSDNIEAALEAVIDDVVATFANMFDNQPSLWDAMIALHYETDGSTVNSGRGKLLAANAFWRGQKIESTINTRNIWDVNGWVVEGKSYRRNTIGSAKWEPLSNLYHLQPAKIECVIVDDLPISGKSKQIMKIKSYLSDNLARKESSLVLRAGGDHTDPAVIANMLEKIGGPTKIVYTSSMPEPATTSVARTSASGVVYVRPRIRMFTFNGANDMHGNTITNLTLSHVKTYYGQVSEIDYAAQPTSGIMVGMTSFDVPKDLYAMVACGLLQWGELRFVNQGDVPKIKDHFENYADVYETRKKAALARFPELAARAALFLDGTLDGLFDQIRTMRPNLNLTAAQQARPFGRIVALFDEMVAPYDAEQKLLAKFVKPALPARVKTGELLQKFRAQQADVEILLDNLTLTEQKHINLILKNL